MNTPRLSDVVITISHLRVRLSRDNARLQQIKVTKAIWDQIIEWAKDNGTADPQTASFRGVPISADLPDDHPKGYELVFVV